LQLVDSRAEPPAAVEHHADDSDNHLQEHHADVPSVEPAVGLENVAVSEVETEAAIQQGVHSRGGLAMADCPIGTQVETSGFRWAHL